MGWEPRADGAHEWIHDVCGDSTVFAARKNPNKPWVRCRQCLSDAGSYSDGGVAGSGNKSRAR